MDNNSILYICAPHNSHIQQLYVAKIPGAGEGLKTKNEKGLAAHTQPTGRPFGYKRKYAAWWGSGAACVWLAWSVWLFGPSVWPVVFVRLARSVVRG